MANKKSAKRSTKAKDSPLFPKIYRFITESWKLLLVSFVSGFLLIAIIFQSMSLYKNLQEEKRLKADRAKTVAELNFWKGVAGKYKNYRDAYFKITTLEYRLGNIDEAKKNLRKTLELDPNFENARKMEKIVGQ